MDTTAELPQPILGRREVLRLLGGTIASAVLIMASSSKGSEQAIREEGAHLNIFNHQESAGTESYPHFRENHQQDVATYAQKYGIPPEALLNVMDRELGSVGQNTILGIGPITAQKIKATINHNRVTLLDDPGDTSGDGQYHIGLSLGMLNLKSGLFTKKVINSLQNEKLKKDMLAHYDDSNDKHHVEDKFFANLIKNNLEIEMELCACHLSHWWPAVERLGMSFEEKCIHLASANACYPYDYNALKAFLRETNSIETPELRDQDTYQPL